jgi:16S rRNA C967 or C1407 C5-methylase (RsmB/RsmF family)
MAKAAHQRNFDTFYYGQWAERWPSLKEALLTEREPVAYAENLKQPYYLDRASLLGAKALPVQSGDRVLDMCAAPGGKTLVLATALKGVGTLVANDRSSARRARLRRVLQQHLTEEYRAVITVTSHDATKWSLYEQEAYDRILLDAPCSSERHVLTAPSAMSQWSPSRPKRLATTQFAMLAAALEAVVIGGLILYATCSINSGENEGIIEKLTERRARRFAIEALALQGAEERSYGSIILPDTNDGIGPLYLCLLRRLS